MNILIINFEYPPLGGGGGVATKQLAEELGNRHNVHVLTSSAAGLAPHEQLGGVHIHRAPVPGRRHQATASLFSMIIFVPAAFILGWFICRQIRFEIINAQFVLPSGLPALALAKLFRLPLVVSLIGGDIYDPTKGTSPHRHWWLRWLVRFVSNRAAVCTAISEDTKKRAREIHGVKKQIVVTHLGLVPTNTPPASRLALDLPPRAIIGVSIGRLIPRKGYDVLLRAWATVSGAYLVIIGSGPHKKKLTALADELGIADRVSFVGFVTEQRKLQLLGAADFYVAAAHHEGFGIVFLEAMEAGLPIVTANVGGQMDFLQDNKNALLVAVADPQQLARAIQKVVSAPQLRRRMGETNKHAVKDFYIDKTAAVFEHVLLGAAKQGI